jgi:homoserine dehydrogenase
MGDVRTRYYVSMRVADRPGVLSTVAGEFSSRNISISTVRQEGAGDDARLVVVTHRAPDSALSETVAALEKLESVLSVSSVLRLEGTND